jgi:hypothetical protein
VANVRCAIGVIDRRREEKRVSHVKCNASWPNPSGEATGKAPGDLIPNEKGAAEAAPI